MRLDPTHVVAVRSLAAAQAVMDAPNPHFGLTSSELVASPVYQALASLFAGMGLDADNQGKSQWNPLRSVLAPGERVVIKPNLVFHEHYRGGRLHGVVTDPRLIRAMADFVFRAIGADGQLVIGDAPLQSANWGLLCERTGLSALPDFYAKQGLRCELRDFRTVASTTEGGLKLHLRRLAGDPGGYRPVNLGTASMHAGRAWENLRVTNYDPAAMQSHHNATRHEYLVSGSLLAATTVINMAKLKTHRKSGLTGPLKNLVGINGCKDWLPHHTKGSKARGGDEYSTEARWKQLSTWLVEHEETSSNQIVKRTWNALRKTVWFAGKRLAADSSWEGSWHGNDTLWRTILDLNRAATYASPDGVLHSSPQRRFFVVVDALLAGEGEGPMAPSPSPIGVLLGGITPAAVELAAARLAGWPAARLPLVVNAFEPHQYPLADFSQDRVQLRAIEASGCSLTDADFSAFVRHLAPCQCWQGLFADASARLAHAS